MGWVMAKFLPNYQPVTWKNVNTGNPAQFFNGAIQGGDTVFDQQTEINETEDARRTNEAIAGGLAGNPTPFDRRVDQTALQQAKGYEDTLRSNMLTAGLDREKTGLEIEQMPEELRLKQEELKSKIANARSAEERNRLQAELNNIALADEARIRKEREQIAGFANNTDSVFDGYLTAAQEAYDARDVPGAETMAGQQVRFEETQAQAQQQLAQYLGNRQGVKDSGLPAYLRPQTPAGIAETAAAGREQSEAAIIQKHTEKQAADYESAYAASENELNAFIVLPDGNIGFGKPSEHKLSAGEAEIMLGDAATKNKSLKFRLEDLESEDKKNLANAAATLSPSVAKEITANVVKQSKVDGGKMDSQEFVDAWNKEAQRYRDKVFPQAREQHANGDQTRYKADELFDLYTGNVTKSADPRLDTQIAPVGERLTARGLNLEIHPDKQGKAAPVLNEISVLMDAIDSKRKPSGVPLTTKQIETKKQQLRSALLKLKKAPLGALPPTLSRQPL
jgi:hypothetical protein